MDASALPHLLLLTQPVIPLVTQKGFLLITTGGTFHGVGGKVVLVPHQVLGEKPRVVQVSPALLAGRVVTSCKDVGETNLHYQNNISLTELFYSMAIHSSECSQHRFQLTGALGGQLW